MSNEERINFLPFVLVLIKRKLFMLLNFVLVCVVAFFYVVFVVDTQYMSSMVFLPPWEPQGMQTLIPNLNLGMGGGADVMPEQIQTVLESKALRMKVIDKFNLYEKYSLSTQPNKIEVALKKLEDDLIVTATEKGNMGITQYVDMMLEAYHTDPDTAFAMVHYAFELMDSTVKAVGAERGERDRTFVEEQLVIAQKRLDSLYAEFRAFQLENRAFDIPEQLRISLETYSTVRASIIANDIQIKRLLLDFTPEHPDVVTLKKMNRALNSKLKNIEDGRRADVLVGLESSTELAPEFANYVRDVEVQNKVLLLLQQELEQAKLKEARNVSSLKIVDHPFVPEYKARPKRAFLLAGIVLAYMLFIGIIVFLQQFYSTRIKNTQAFSQIRDALRTW